MLVQIGFVRRADVALSCGAAKAMTSRCCSTAFPLNVPGGAINLANLGTADLDRIEVVRGPASVLYGADAMSGVIQLFTRSGAGPPHGTIAARRRDVRYRRLSGTVAGGGGPWSFSGTASRFTSAGTYPFNSGYRDAVGTAQVRWERGGRPGRAGGPLRRRHRSLSDRRGRRRRGSQPVHHRDHARPWCSMRRIR